VPEQVPDVGADPKIAELAGIDGYAQDVGILFQPGGQRTLEPQIDPQ
jgi:hypothetical protein